MEDSQNIGSFIQLACDITNNRITTWMKLCAAGRASKILSNESSFSKAWCTIPKKLSIFIQLAWDITNKRRARGMKLFPVGNASKAISNEAPFSIARCTIPNMIDFYSTCMRYLRHEKSMKLDLKIFNKNLSYFEAYFIWKQTMRRSIFMRSVLKRMCYVPWICSSNWTNFHKV